MSSIPNHNNFFINLAKYLLEPVKVKVGSMCVENTNVPPLCEHCRPLKTGLVCKLSPPQETLCIMMLDVLHLG